MCLEPKEKNILPGKKYGKVVIFNVSFGTLTATKAVF